VKGRDHDLRDLEGIALIFSFVLFVIGKNTVLVLIIIIYSSSKRLSLLASMRCPQMNGIV
jgi:hypothetical protein